MKYDDMQAPKPASWQSPAGSWTVYRAVIEDHDRQQALDRLTSAINRLQYVQGWATLDNAESECLSSAISDIRAAIKEFSQ